MGDHTMKMRAVIAEDEPIARQAIVEMAGACGIQVLAECKDGAETIHALQVFRPDVVFLDVHMPGIDGLGVLRRVPADRLPAVIFTTAYNQYAVQAFEHNAVDYLLKPFDEERFRKAVARAELQRANRSNPMELISSMVAELNQSRRSQTSPQRLVIRSRGKVEFVRVDQIDWIEASHNYLKIHVGSEVYLLRQSIGEIEARLEPDRFLRIHRSLIVSVDRIRRLEACGYGEYLVVLQDGKSLSLSRGYRSHLDRFLDKIVTSERSQPYASHPSSGPNGRN
jgi:two-component system, LytTR family, response regulator